MMLPEMKIFLKNKQTTYIVHRAQKEKIVQNYCIKKAKQG